MAETQLAAFVEYCKRFPEQYTPEWFKMIDFIGGSEMNDLILAPFTLATRKIKNAYKLKYGIQEDAPAPPAEIVGGREPYFDADGKYAMGWGTLFEPLLCDYIARKMSLKIDARAVSHFDGPYRYSPDGAFIDANGDCGVLEMKNPFARTITSFDPHNNDTLIAPHMLVSNPTEVPEKYIPQLQAGLRAMPFAKYAYFVEAMYRRLNDRGQPSSIVMQKTKILADAECLDSGVIGFYHASGCGNRENVIQLSSNYDKTLVLEVLSHLHGADAYIPYYFKPDGTVNTTIEDLPDTWQGLPLYGYMPWGLFAIHSARVNRDDAFFTPEITSNATHIAEAVHAILHADRDPICTIRELQAKIICKKDTTKELQNCIATLEQLQIKCRDDKQPCIPTSQQDAEF